jgi:putative ATPase
MAQPHFYRPVERGLEIRIAEKLRQLKALNATKSHGRADDAA